MDQFTSDARQPRCSLPPGRTRAVCLLRVPDYRPAAEPSVRTAGSLIEDRWKRPEGTMPGPAQRVVVQAPSM